MRRRLFDTDVPLDLVFGITRPLIWRDDPPSRADKIALRSAPMYPPHDETFCADVSAAYYTMSIRHGRCLLDGALMSLLRCRALFTLRAESF